MRLFVAIAATAPVGACNLDYMAVATVDSVDLADGVIVHHPPETDPFPINLHFMGDFPEWTDTVFADGVAKWGATLAPTYTAPFEVAHDPDQWGVSLVVGDTLPAGMNVYVFPHVGECGSPRVNGCAGPLWSHRWAVSDATHEAAGAVFLRMQAFDSIYTHVTANGWTSNVRENLSEVFIHELAHVFGIGSSPRWIAALRYPRDEGEPHPLNNVLDDAEAIATFKRMLGSAVFPSPDVLVPIYNPGASHWDGCAGHYDIMGNYTDDRYTGVTPLTLASLGHGFAVNLYAPLIMPFRDPWFRQPPRNPSMVGTVNQEVWNDDVSWCVDGVTTPPSAHAAQVAPDAPLRGWGNDVLLPSPMH